MTVTIKALGLERLSPEERVQLAEELLDSVVDHRPLLSEAHREDLRQRLEHYRDNPEQGSAWEVVKARIIGGAS